jgi:DNA-binding MarR family transcriptional regulator
MHEPEIVNSFRRILQALRLAAVQTQGQTGISAAQLFVLSQLKEADALSINQLARATMTDRSSVADVVERLVERKLVRRAASPEDKRKADVRLTAAGRALLRRAPQPPTELLLQGLRGLKETEVKALARLLERFCAELQLADGQPPMLFEGRKQRKRTRSVR